MLRAVAFKNFIHFRDHQSLEFQNGPNFIVGPNGSGKSAIFELVRRCLANKVNISASTIAEFPAFVISKFEIREALSDKLLAGSHVYSCLYMKSPQEKYKLVCIRNNGPEQETSYLDSYSKVDSQWTITQSAVLTDSNTEIFTESNTQTVKLSEILDKLIKSDESLHVLDSVIENTIKDPQPPDQIGWFWSILLYVPRTLTALVTKNAKSNTSECETILTDIYATVVSTFPIRSPGPTQWTHSENMGTGSEHYDTTIEKAEILQTLLGSPDVDEEKAKSIFDMIISPLKYIFRINEQSNIIVNDGERDIRLLKVPVGILEAKQFSLMFAHKKYQTLMLEEPDRGMHPHMIQKLRDLVLRTEQEKVLVLTTHQTSMINQWSMSNMFICRRTKNAPDGKLEHHVLKLKEKVDKIYKLQDVLKEVLFSEVVLFVEGVTDKQIIRSVFDLILNGEGVDQLPREDQETLKKTIAKTNVIGMDGSRSCKDLEKVGKNLGVRCAFLLDNDITFKGKAKIRRKGKNDKQWKERVIYCVQNLLQSSATSKAVTDVMKEDAHTDDGGQLTIQEAMGFADPLDGSICTVERVIRDLLLPETFELKGNYFDLPDEIKKTSNEKIIQHLKHERSAFLWNSGDLEDMICKSILKAVSHSSDDEERRSDSKTLSPDEEEKRSSDSKTLLLELFQQPKQSTSKVKNPIKENIMQLDFTKPISLRQKELPKTFSGILLRGDEMKSFLRFLLDLEKKNHQKSN